MPREKTSEKLIARIYRRKYEDLGMFFFVEGQKNILPGISVERALYNYYAYIGNDDFNIESAITTFTCMRKEYYEAAKSDK